MFLLLNKKRKKKKKKVSLDLLNQVADMDKRIRVLKLPDGSTGLSAGRNQVSVVFGLFGFQTIMSGNSCKFRTVSNHVG